MSPLIRYLLAMVFIFFIDYIAIEDIDFDLLFFLIPITGVTEIII